MPDEINPVESILSELVNIRQHGYRRIRVEEFPIIIKLAESVLPHGTSLPPNQALGEFLRHAIEQSEYSSLLEILFGMRPNDETKKTKELRDEARLRYDPNLAEGSFRYTHEKKILLRSLAQTIHYRYVLQRQAKVSTTVEQTPASPIPTEERLVNPDHHHWQQPNHPIPHYQPHPAHRNPNPSRKKAVLALFGTTVLLLVAGLVFRPTITISGKATAQLSPSEQQVDTVQASVTYFRTRGSSWQFAFDKENKKGSEKFQDDMKLPQDPEGMSALLDSAFADDAYAIGAISVHIEFKNFYSEPVTIRGVSIQDKESFSIPSGVAVLVTAGANNEPPMIMDADAAYPVPRTYQDDQVGGNYFEEHSIRLDSDRQPTVLPIFITADKAAYTFTLNLELETPYGRKNQTIDYRGKPFRLTGAVCHLPEFPSIQYDRMLILEYSDKGLPFLNDIPDSEREDYSC